MKYNIHRLDIETTKKGQIYDSLEDNAVKVVNYLKKSIQKETLECLNVYYGQGDGCYMMVYAEKSCSFILIHDERIKKSYNFSNKDYANDETEVELAGYYFPQMCICENKTLFNF